MVQHVLASAHVLSAKGELREPVVCANMAPVAFPIKQELTYHRVGTDTTL